MGSKKEEFQITEDEVKKIGEALKDEKFRKLFLEYAEEIQNPENRELYEKEISMLEQERGMNVQFIHPQPGHVLKTSVDGDTKAFINICQNDKIGQPVSKREVSADGKSGLNWSIPHSHTPPRDDLDKAGSKCRIYDVVFHPDTYRMASSNTRFRGIVEDTAIEGIEKQFGVKVDRKNMKRPKLNYKGTPTATVIRSKANDGSKNLDDNDPLKNMPYPYGDKTSAEKAKEMAEEVKKKKQIQNEMAGNAKLGNKRVKMNEDSTVPKYTVTHRSDMDLQEFTNSRDSRPSTRPKELVVTIELPLLSSAKPVELDIFEQKLAMKSSEPAKYNLDLNLPFPVDDENGSAKFDKTKRCLIVTLPVIPEEVPKLLHSDPEAITDNSTQKEDIDKPLIEVMSTTDNVVQSKSNFTENVKDKCMSSTYISHSPKVSYDVPPFEFSQDHETVTFVLNVKKIVSDSVSKLFPLPNVCHIKFMSRGSGGFPLYYSFLAKFSAQNCFVPEHCFFDISECNAVLLLLKEKESRGSWEDFLVGVSLDELKNCTFETESNLFDELEKIEAECLEDSTDNKTLEVTEMTRKKLAIKIQKKEQNENVKRDEKQQAVMEADDEHEEGEECPLSADIKVIHDKVMPNLHGILKQRTVSESSEDLSLSASSGSGSPESPRDEFFKKSVTFNEHVDKATFKTKAAVSSMTQALKSKRRRMRKKQEKRNRRNSGSSEGSSDEHRYSDGDHSDKGVERIEENTQEDEEESEAPVNETGDASISTSDGPQGLHEKLVQDIKDKLTLTENMENDDSDDEIGTACDNMINDLGDVVSESVNENIILAKEMIELNEENTVTVPASLISKPSDLTSIIGDGDSIVKIKAGENTSGNDSGVECTEGSGEKEDKSDVDTMLSWNDNLQSQEHRTECAFEFTNASIYDLDVD